MNAAARQESRRWLGASVIGSLVLLIGCAAGLFARFHGLGERQLAEDEYFFLESVGRILEQGLPAFPGGGYYTHGLPAQYITAASMLVFGDSGFAQRLPAALFGLASVALLFVYARPQLGRALAAVLAVLLLVSSWEIEFSRFARMYAPFQCATLAYLIAYDRALLGDRWNWRYLAHLAAVAMVLTHNLGVFLVPLLFVPLLVESGAVRFPTRAHTVRYALASAATALACISYTQIGFRNWGVIDRYPIGFVREASSVLRFPEFPFWSASPEPISSLAVLIAALALGAIIPASIGVYRGNRKWVVVGLTGLLLVSTALHALVISAICAALLIFRYEVHRGGATGRGHRAAFAVSAVMAMSWLIYALVTRDWILRVTDGTSSLIGGLRRTFFGWPDLYAPLVVPWRDALPGIGVVTALAVAHQLWTNRKQPAAMLARNPAILIVLVALELGLVVTFFETGTRYAYFVYPVALYTVALSIAQLTRAMLSLRGVRADLTAGAACLVLFALSSDFDPRHLVGVTGPEASFRMGVFEDREATWYPRYDYASPADFLRTRADPQQRIPIVVVGLPTVSHYLDLDHAVFYPLGQPIFLMVSRERGTRELWSQRPLLSTEEALRNYTAGARAVWLVRLTAVERQPFQVTEVWADRLLDAHREFVSRDGRIEVLSVALRSVRTGR